MTNLQSPGRGPRHINPVLMFGIIALPTVFVWILLLPGYARSTRTAAFIYAFAFPVLYVAVFLAIELSGR